MPRRVKKLRSSWDSIPWRSLRCSYHWATWNPGSRVKTSYISSTAWRLQLTPISFSLACKPKVINHLPLQICHCLKIMYLPKPGYRRNGTKLQTLCCWSVLTCMGGWGGLLVGPLLLIVSSADLDLQWKISAPVLNSCTKQAGNPKCPPPPWCSNHSLEKIDKSFSIFTLTASQLLWMLKLSSSPGD